MSGDSDSEEVLLRNILLSPYKKKSSTLDHSTPLNDATERHHKRSSRHHKKRKRRHSDHFDDESPVRKKADLSSSQDSSIDDLLSSCNYENSPTTTPSGRDNKAGWYDIHEKHVSIAKSSRSEVVLIGDSIVAGLSRYPNVWRTYFGQYQAVNLGIGGDRTQHVLWRAKNITLPNMAKYLIIHCGTNNIDRDSPKEIANGIISIGLLSQEKKPGLKVVVTGLLPRDIEENFRRTKIKHVNRYLKSFCKNGKLENFCYMSQDKDWTSDDGTLIAAYYFTDYLHLVESGNEKFARSIVNVIEKLKRDEKIEYSDDDENAADLSQTDFNHDDYHVTKYSLSRGSQSRDNSRLRHESKEDYERKERRKRRFTPDSSFDNESPYKWSKARKWAKIIKEEHHNHYKKLDNSKSPANDTSTEEIKSIDISLADEERKKARLSKFSLTPSSFIKDLHQMSSNAKNRVLSKPGGQSNENHNKTDTLSPIDRGFSKPTKKEYAGNGEAGEAENGEKVGGENESEMTKRIRMKSLEARKELEGQKHIHSTTIVNYGSPSSKSLENSSYSPSKAFKNVTKEDMRKFFTDYGSGSDTE